MKVQGLHFSIDGKTLLHDISFEIPEASVFLILGPNGAGKTMLLRCLAGLKNPDNADACFRSRPSKLSWVPLSQSLPFTFSVRDILIMGRYAEHQGFPGRDDEAEVEQAAKRLGIESLLERTYNSLSRGEQTKTDIARALAAKASWIFLDEPFSNLDIDASLQMIELFRELKTEGRTLVLSHHDLYTAKDLATHGLLLREGQVLGSGHFSEIFTSEAIKAAYGVIPHFTGEGRVSHFERARL